MAEGQARRFHAVGVGMTVLIASALSVVGFVYTSRIPADQDRSEAFVAVTSLTVGWVAYAAIDWLI